VMNQSILTDSKLASVVTNGAWSFDRQSLQQHFTILDLFLGTRIVNVKAF
jgi:hypothetical protein